MVPLTSVHLTAQGGHHVRSSFPALRKPRPGGRGRRAWRVSMLPIAGAAVLSLGAGLIAAPPAVAADSDRGHGPGQTAWPAPTPKPAPSAQESAITKALAEAKSSGKRVAIADLTTAGSQTFANPGGTLTTDTAAVPERLKGAD